MLQCTPEDDELTKSRRNRALPLHIEAHTALSELWDKARKIIRDGQAQPRCAYVFCHAGGMRYSPDWIDRELKPTRLRARVRDCTIHDLRRSFSTLAQRAGVDPHVVQALGGWSTVGVVKEHSTGDVSEAHRSAMDKIEGYDNATAVG